MRIVRLLAVVALLTGSSIAAVADHHEELVAAVRAIGDAQAEALVANDVEAMLSIYAEDAISMPNFGPRMQGMEALRAHHAQMEGVGMKVLSFESDPTEVWEAGEQVIEIGVYEIRLEMAAMPEPIEDRGKYMTVYERNADGELRIKAEIWNTDLNPMMQE